MGCECMAAYQLRRGANLLGTLQDCQALDEHSTRCTFTAEPAFEEHRPLFEKWLRGINTEGGEGLMMWLEADHAIQVLGLYIVSLDTGDEVADFILTIDGDQAVYRPSYAPK